MGPRMKISTRNVVGCDQLAMATLGYDTTMIALQVNQIGQLPCKAVAIYNLVSQFHSDKILAGNTL